MSEIFQITTASYDNLRVGDIVFCAGRAWRVSQGMDGKHYLYPQWTGVNRHQRRAQRAEYLRLIKRRHRT